MIMSLAEKDLALFRKLHRAAAAINEDDKKLDARLRKAIDGATHTRGFVDYHAAAGWAAEVDATLDALAALAASRHCAVVLKLAERAIERIERAVEDVDDSDGHCTTLLDRAGSIYLAAARTAKPEPVQFARDLFAREMASDYDIFQGAAALYADVLGGEGLAEYRRLAAAAGSGCPRSRADKRGGTPRPIMTGWRRSSTFSLSRTAMSMPALRFVQRTCRQHPGTCSLPSSVARMAGRMKRCAARRKACGCSRETGRTKGS
jgi:hypothetical protein